MPYNSRFIHTIKTFRLISGSAIQISYGPNLTGVACLIQPMSAEASAKVNMTFDSAYYCYVVYPTDIKKGDKVIDQDGTEYRVMGSLKHNYGGNANICFYLSEQAGDGN
jgi:hypothetical protein